MQKPKKTPITWILVADGSGAQIYTQTTEKRSMPFDGNLKQHRREKVSVEELVSVPDMEFTAESIEEYETGPNRLGRVFESANSAHHMAEPRLTIQDEIKQHLLRNVADRLNRALTEQSFDRLVLVAPPKMLGALRELLTPAVTKCVIAELPKDLMHDNCKALLQHLQQMGLKSA